MYLNPDEVSLADETSRLINSVIQDQLLCAAHKSFYFKIAAIRDNKVLTLILQFSGMSGPYKTEFGDDSKSATRESQS